jgi:hypothetical protein
LSRTTRSSISNQVKTEKHQGPAVLHHSSTKAQSGLTRNRAVHRFRAPFLCSFLLEKQKKGEEINTRKKEETSLEEAKYRQH